MIEKIKNILSNSYTKQGEFDENKALNELCVLLDVSLSFEAKEKIIDLHGYVTEIEEVDGDVVWFYDQNGEYMSLRKKYVKRYSS